MNPIIQISQNETGTQISGKDWVVQVYLASHYTGCWYARNEHSESPHEKLVCCGDRKLAANQAVEFVLANLGAQ